MVGFLALEEDDDDEALSFLDFFSGTAGEEEVVGSTGPKTATEEGSTNVESLLGVESIFFASLFSFFSL